MIFIHPGASVAHPACTRECVHKAGIGE